VPPQSVPRGPPHFVAKKFILVDQSISSIAGHHYEYAVHVLEAAQRAGYVPYLATHQRFAEKRKGSAAVVPWKVHAIYRYGFWAAQGTPGFAPLAWLRGAVARLRFRFLVWFRFSPLGIAWEVRTRFGEFLLKQPFDRPHILSLFTLVPSVFGLKIVRFLILLALLPVMALVFLWRSAARLLKAGGFPQSYVRSLVADVADFVHLGQLVFTRRVQMLNWLQQYRCIRAFAADTRRMLAAIEPDEGDVLFLPTVSAIELMGLVQVLTNDRARRPAWNLMFRRDIYRGRAGDYAAQEAGVNELRQVLGNCAQKLAGARVLCFTDTDELSEQYNRLGAFHFRTGPIPHTHGPVARASACAPVRIIYIGDARKEKGYHLLPGLIRDLWDDYVVTGKATFHLQSNYNVPQGEPEAVIAREQMEALPADKVELLKAPMTSKEYREFLLSGGINLLLYDPANYYARSSGILVESLTAGVPVIVPAGSWLARQFLAETQRHQEGLRERMRPLKSYTASQLRWSVHGNSRLNARANGEIVATQAGKAFTWVRVPPGATHLLLTLRFGAAPREALVYLEQVDMRGHELDTSYPRLFEAEKREGKAVGLIPLHPRASKLGFSVGSLYAYAGVAISDVQLEFLASDAALPTGAVGLIYHDLDEVPRLLREMIDHHAHYLATAGEFAREYYAYHNADRLIEELVR
jgi:hypothetical protein